MSEPLTLLLEIGFPSGKDRAFSDAVFALFDHPRFAELDPTVKAMALEGAARVLRCRSISSVSIGTIQVDRPVDRDGRWPT